MFPYPSGAGLHVGHPEGYTATDIMARFKRMRGFNVLHPMGWDAFGLPAERYAMQTGIHPEITTRKNIDNFRRQLRSIGFSYDWQREINTTRPDYYRWTQWIFLKIFNSWYDETEKRARPIEELPIPEGLNRKGAEREEYINSRRLAYIAEMPVNWCAELGTVLANEEVDEWVSKGYRVERKPMRQWMLRITAYAERLLDDLKHVEWPTGTLELQKNWIGRSDGAEVDFSFKVDPARSLRIYTTRPDTLFGATYMVIAPEHPDVVLLTAKDRQNIVNDYIEKSRLKSELERTVQGAKAEKSGVFTGGYVVHPLTGEDIPVWIADYVLLGYGTGAIMAVPAHDERDFEFAKRFGLPIRRVVEKKRGEAGQNSSEAFTGEGFGINSDFLNGLPTPEAQEAMITHLEKGGKGTRKTNYKLRDWLFSRQRYWGEPIPVSFDESGGFVAEQESELPLLLPRSESFQPTADGQSPLANLPDWIHHEKGGVKLKRETNTMPQWAGSSWYYLRFIDPENKERLVDPKKEAYWMGSGGVDLYVGGAEHAVLHLLYARFWHKVLFDLGHVSTPEPFKKLIHQGLILGEDGQKMSKSRGNVVNPDDVIREYGADSFRMFEMFLGPLEQMKPWSSNGIEGIHRFLARVWRLYTPPAEEASNGVDPELLAETPEELRRNYERLRHVTIQRVTEDIERMSFNTAISRMMIFVNESAAKKRIGRSAAEDFVKLLSPFAPHIAEELWALLGHTTSIAYEPWPSFDESKTGEDEIEVVFQINGRIRSKARVAADLPDDEMQKRALDDEQVQKYLEGKPPKKIIVVKNKLVNIVV
jgi:leucyl-tRNA synthetase